MIALTQPQTTSRLLRIRPKGGAGDVVLGRGSVVRLTGGVARCMGPRLLEVDTCAGLADAYEQDLQQAGIQTRSFLGLGHPLHPFTPSPLHPARSAPFDRIGGFDAGECETPIKLFLWPSDVDDFKKSLDPAAEGLDRAVKACPGLPQTQKDSWDVFFKAWKQFLAEPTPTFGSHQKWLNTCRFSKTMDGWQAAVQQANCPAFAPGVKGFELFTDKTGDFLRTALVVVGVGAAVVAVVVYAPEIKVALGIGRKTR